MFYVMLRQHVCSGVVAILSVYSKLAIKNVISVGFISN